MSESQMSDSKFAKRFFTMISLLVLLTIVLVVLAIINSSEVMTKLDQDKQSDIDQVVAERVQPVGTLNVGEQPQEMAAADTGGGESGQASGEAPSGEQVYQQACAACHAAGVAGAPKFGDPSVWTDRIAKGDEMLYDHAINGFQGEAGLMPAKGGNASLSDDAVRAAVDYMVQAVTGEAPGAASGESAAAPTDSDMASESGEAPAAQEQPQSESAGAATEAEGDSADTAASADGAAVYQQACAMCHATGVAGAPKVGDTAAWEARIAQGAEVLYDHAINGFQGEAGMMPAKGGNTSLGDGDVRAAVDHMISESQ